MTTKSSEREAADKRVEKAAEEPAAEPASPDETIPGGKYIVDGKEVDANGEPIKKGKKKEE